MRQKITAAVLTSILFVSCATQDPRHFDSVAQPDPCRATDPSGEDIARAEIGRRVAVASGKTMGAMRGARDGAILGAAAGLLLADTSGLTLGAGAAVGALTGAVVGAVRGARRPSRTAERRSLPERPAGAARDCGAPAKVQN